MDDEAIRALWRAREEAIADLKAAKFRLQAVWRRHDLRYPGRAPWSPAHLRGLREVVWPTPAPQLVCQASGRAGPEPTQRLQRLEQALQAQVAAWRLNPVVEALQALRGVQFPVAVTTVAELGDLSRVAHPRPLMKDLGLIPSDYAPGARRRPGAMTQAGNTQARRALVEGAWAYRDPANGSRHRQRRREQHPKVIPDRSWKAQLRLCQRSRRVIARGKHAKPVVVAIARELVGCMWAMAQQVPVTPSPMADRCPPP